MLVTLLATCDPCGAVDRGAPPFQYNPIATKVLQVLQRRRYNPADIILQLPGEADAAWALAFAYAATDWWIAQQDAMSRTRGGVAMRGLAG